MKKISVDLIRAAPYMLMLVLHKDALFHYACFKSGEALYGYSILDA
jgi:hypothetical protein